MSHESFGPVKSCDHCPVFEWWFWFRLRCSYERYYTNMLFKFDRAWDVTRLESLWAPTGLRHCAYVNRIHTCGNHIDNHGHSHCTYCGFSAWQHDPVTLRIWNSYYPCLLWDQSTYTCTGFSAILLLWIATHMRKIRGASLPHFLKYKGLGLYFLYKIFTWSLNRVGLKSRPGIY